nr:hypothetical protein [Tanacetum cinerariifolium]
MKLDQFTQFHFHFLTGEEWWIQIEEYVQYQDNLWDEPLPSMNVSSISKALQPTLKGCLEKAYKQISFLETPTREVGLKNPYLIYDYCIGPHESDECEQNNSSEQVCLSGGDIYNDPSLIRFYQNDDTSPQGNYKREEKGEDSPKWTVRSKFEDELANFMLEKKLQAKGIGDTLLLVVSRDGAEKGGSRVLIPDLVVMERVGASGPHESDECEQNNPSEQVCLSGGDIYNDPSLIRFYQNDDTSPQGNYKREEKGEDSPKWNVRSKFEGELANFMLEKKLQAKGIGDTLVQHRKGLREQYS